MDYDKSEEVRRYLRPVVTSEDAEHNEIVLAARAGGASISVRGGLIDIISVLTAVRAAADLPAMDSSAQASLAKVVLQNYGRSLNSAELYLAGCHYFKDENGRLYNRLGADWWCAACDKFLTERQKALARHTASPVDTDAEVALRKEAAEKEWQAFVLEAWQECRRRFPNGASIEDAYYCNLGQYDLARADIYQELYNKGIRLPIDRMTEIRTFVEDQPVKKFREKDIFVKAIEYQPDVKTMCRRVAAVMLMSQTNKQDTQ